MGGIKLTIALAAALALSACGNSAMEVQSSANGAEAALIAKVKHCELWRVKDHTHVYMTICDGDVAGDTQHDYSCGKGCTRTQFNVGAN